MKRVTCFYCGNVYPAPNLHQAFPEEGIACPRCSTQNDVNGDLPDWDGRTVS